MAEEKKDPEIQEEVLEETVEETEEVEEAVVEEDASEISEETTEETEDEKEEKPKKSFFKKKEKKDEKEEKIKDLTDRLQRLMAEFDNYRKRTEKEKSQMYDMGISVALEKMLPVLDNFERGLATVPEEEKESAVATGMDKIYKQMVKTLEDMGVEPMDATGKEFDPNLHNAVMQVENDELEENTVAAELQKGYTYKGNVLRHAMVSVVK